MAHSIVSGGHSDKKHVGLKHQKNKKKRKKSKLVAVSINRKQ